MKIRSGVFELSSKKKIIINRHDLVAEQRVGLPSDVRTNQIQIFYKRIQDQSATLRIHSILFV